MKSKKQLVHTINIRPFKTFLLPELLSPASELRYMLARYEVTLPNMSVLSAVKKIALRIIVASSPKARLKSSTQHKEKNKIFRDLDTKKERFSEKELGFC